MENEGFYLEVEVDSSKDKSFYYCPNSKVKKGDGVIVENGFGVEYGLITRDPIRESESSQLATSKQVLREASEDDRAKYIANKEAAIKAGKIFNDSVKKLELNMKLIDTIYTLDKSKVLFTYVSEERVDFRELLKELSTILKCRIELKQIGPRDRSKVVGGIGICGLPLCCKSFLNEFEGISINMAKNQFLALNIQKLSGQCSKLLCCLKYEDEQYSQLKKDAPKYGVKFKCDDVDYKVGAVNLLAKTVKIESLDKEIIKTISFEEFDEMIKK